VTDLGKVPEGEAEIARLYHELSRIGARVEGRRMPWRFGRPSPEELLVLAAQAGRRDPRLLWAVVELLVRRFEAFDPLRLRRTTLRARWPAALPVALEFASRVVRSDEFRDWARFVTAPVLPARGERFFLGTRAFAGEQARRDAEESLSEYKRWGYFGREEPFAKELGATPRGTLGPAERRNVLRRIASRRGAVTLSEYLEALGGRASSRQASRDLAVADFLVREGRTRGARWRYVGPGAREAPAREG
jgi:hypothetical protein